MHVQYKGYKILHDLSESFYYDWSAILGIWDLNVPTLTLNPVIELNCFQLISLIYLSYSRAQKSVSVESAIEARLFGREH